MIYTLAVRRFCTHQLIIDKDEDEDEGVDGCDDKRKEKENAKEPMFWFEASEKVGLDFSQTCISRHVAQLS